MSHFSLLVVTRERPSNAALTAALAPYHEFESTGDSDQYVVDVDITDEARAGYEKDTEAMVRGPNNELVSRYDDRFYRDPTPEESEKVGSMGGEGVAGGLIFSSHDWGDGKGYRTRVHEIPAGWTEVNVLTKETKTFAEYIEDYYAFKAVRHLSVPDTADSHKSGYYLLDNTDEEVIKVVNRTNPNKKWDWWSVGGRWTGMFVPHYDPDKDPANLESCILCRGTGKRMDPVAVKLRETQPDYGCNGCNGTGKAVKFPSHWRNVGNQARKADIDFFALREAKAAEAGALYDKRHAIIAGRPIPKWQVIHDAWMALPGDRAENIKGAREAYNTDPVIKDLHAADQRFFFNADDIEALDCPRETYLERARNGAVATFAVLKDGQWYERGRMGWWAIVHDEKDGDEWCREFSRLIDDLPDDTWLSVIDCHI